jgi:hypothetical protein
MKAVKLGIKACFWVATQEIPNSKFKALLKFLGIYKFLKHSIH